MAEIPKVDSEGLRLAAAEGHKRVSSVTRITESRHCEPSAAEIKRLRASRDKAIEIGLGLARAYKGYLPDPERVDTRGDVNTRLMFIEDERKKLLAIWHGTEEQKNEHV